MQQISVSVYLPTAGTNVKVLDPQAVEMEIMSLYNNLYNIQRDIEFMKEKDRDFVAYVQREYPEVAKSYMVWRAAQERIK